MKALRILVILGLVYICLVLLFESLLGFFQPITGDTLVIATGDNSHSRVVARLESNGQLYVAANHWPRAWYRQVLDNPAVQVTLDGITGDFTAVPVEGAEFDRVNSENSLPLAFKILTGFPPRRLVRLDPRQAGT